VLVLLDVDVLIVVEVEVVVNRTPNHVLPVYLNHAFCELSQYSSPVKGFDGAVEATFKSPSKLVICVFAIFILSY
jgi:hypothetical protein